MRKQIQKYHVLDFSGWQQDDVFDQQFQKLIDGLGLHYPRQAEEDTSG